MRFVAIAGLGALGLLYAGSAQALTISNEDANPHTITVTAGGDSKQLTIEPEKEVDAPCSDGCKVKLENGEEYDLKGGEGVSIEDGVIFVDSSPDANIGDAPDIDPDAPGAGEGPPAGDDSAGAKKQ
jgi:hypothetical protein